MQKIILIAMVIWAAVVANMPSLPLVSGAKTIITDGKAGAVGQGSDSNLTVGNPQTPGRIAFGYPQLNPPNK